VRMPAESGRGARSHAGLALASAALLAAVAVVVLVLASGRSGPARVRPGGARDAVSADGAGHSADTAVEVVQTTSDLSDRLTRLRALALTTSPARGAFVIRIDDAVRYQRVTGVGAAMTDTSAWLLADELPAAARAAVMADLFGPDGIHLRVLRLPIGASDFTHDRMPYSYDDLAPGQSDPTLAHFSVAHDDAYIIPMLRQALSLDPGLEILASPWSPPAWMKTNASLANFEDRGGLRPGDYGAWARYLAAFLQAYARRHVRIAAITPQNEPGEESRYPGLDLTVGEEDLLIARYLVPALAADDLHPAVYALDATWRRRRRAEVIVGDRAVVRHVAGLAWHCYSGNPSAMSALHRLSPRLAEIVSECSTGIAPGPSAELVIAAMRNWASTVILWNLALDPAGGPVQPPNHGCPHCTGIVSVDERTHTVSDTADYYELGQFGEFVQPGARRIASNDFVTDTYADRKLGVGYTTPGLDDVAFANPDGTYVLLVHNSASHAIRFAVSWRGRSFTHALPAGATVTFMWR
jgi:glucosylceramidase